MKSSRFSRVLLLVVTAILFPATASQAGPPTYALAKKLSFAATRMIADPARPRIYATLRSQNSVLVINTDDFTTQTIPIGSSPYGLALSPDGSKLYVANSGSSTAAVGVLDLNTLQTLSSVSAPAQPLNVVVGNNGVLYLTPSSTTGGLMRVDTVAATSSTFGGFGYQNGYLQISPDRNILYFTDSGISPATLQSYDVSGTTPKLLQTHRSNGADSRDFKISHNGAFLAAPSGGGNGSGYSTALIPSNDLNGVIGTLQIGAYPGPIAFSPDDKFAYEAAYSQNIVHIFDLSTFAETARISMGSSGITDYSDITTDGPGQYLFVATSDFSTPSNAAVWIYSIAPTVDRSYPLNISTRLRIESGENVLIGGFIIQGGADKKIIIRALGPSLASQGVANVLDDPYLELHDSTGKILKSNNNWADTQASDIQATGLQPSDARESAILTTLSPGSYTAIVRSNSGNFGVGLVELYDLDSQPAAPKLVNISTRGYVQTQDNVMIAGFIVGGNGNLNSKVVVRAIGPSLSQAGVSGALADPFLELHDGNGAIIAQNDNWKDSQQADIQATGLAPTNDLESAILATVPPGGYTAIVRGNNGGIGVGLAEVYDIQQ